MFLLKVFFGGLTKAPFGDVVFVFFFLGFLSKSEYVSLPVIFLMVILGFLFVLGFGDVGDPRQHVVLKMLVTF